MNRAKTFLCQLWRNQRLAILVVSINDEWHYSQRVLAVGAKGYLMKRDAAKKIVSVIYELLAGKIYLSEEMKLKLLYEHENFGSAR